MIMSGRTGTYGIIHTKDGVKCMYHSINKNEFYKDKNNPTLREYINFINNPTIGELGVFEVGGLGKDTIRLINPIHYKYITRKIQISLFGTSDFEEVLLTQEDYQNLKEKHPDITPAEAQLMEIYNIEQQFLNGTTIEDCCNIGKALDFNDFQMMYWIYDKIILSNSTTISIDNSRKIEKLNHTQFIEKFPNLKIENIL